MPRRTPEPGMDPHGPLGPRRPQAHELPVPTGDRLGDWVGWWLEGRCGCKTMSLPVDMLVRAHGHQHRVRDVIGRMRCKDRCGQRPRFTGLADQIGDERYALGRRVVEVP